MEGKRLFARGSVVLYIADPFVVRSTHWFIVLLVGTQYARGLELGGRIQNQYMKNINLTPIPKLINSKRASPPQLGFCQRSLKVCVLKPQA